MRNLAVRLDEVGHVTATNSEVGIVELRDLGIPYMVIAESSAETIGRSVVVGSLRGGLVILGSAEIRACEDPIVVEVVYPADWNFIGHSCLHRNELIMLSNVPQKLVMLLGGDESCSIIEFEDDERRWDFELRKAGFELEFARTKQRFDTLANAEDIEYALQNEVGAEHPGGFMPSN